MKLTQSPSSSHVFLVFRHSALTYHLKTMKSRHQWVCTAISHSSIPSNAHSRRAVDKRSHYHGKTLIVIKFINKLRVARLTGFMGTPRLQPQMLANNA